jgi:hypothetical protein
MPERPVLHAVEYDATSAEGTPSSMAHSTPVLPAGV